MDVNFRGCSILCIFEIKIGNQNNYGKDTNFFDQSSCTSAAGTVSLWTVTEVQPTVFYKAKAAMRIPSLCWVSEQEIYAVLSPKIIAIYTFIATNIANMQQ